MYKDLDFSILVVHRAIKLDTLAGQRVRDLSAELQADGFEVLATASPEEGRILAASHHGLAAILVAAEGAGDNRRLLQDVIDLIRTAHRRAPRLPIFALGEQITIEHAPAEAMADLNELRGLLYLFEDSAAFLAGQVSRAARNYLENLLPPFFKALIEHTTRSSYSWHTPGHGGGVAFRKTAVGQAFHRFFGENTLRADLSVSVPELGSLLDHTGPLAEAEQRAARNFGADHSFFVINGTSTANKIIWHAQVARGDLVLVDRNCHKSILHAIIMTGAIPIYLKPARNALGIIGPIPLQQLAPDSIAEAIAGHPLIPAGHPQRIRLAVLTNATYDGLCYHAGQVKQALGEQVDILHFDEAWFGYAAFHEFYAGRYGMDTREQGPLVFSTHSSHKMLAAFSQASMIHVLDSCRHRLDPVRFNEAFMMHTSTSPQYGILASLDVASAMMEGGSGRSLLQETFEEALSFRRALDALQPQAGNEGQEWWFEVWQPPQTREASDICRTDWLLTPDADWHGFEQITPEYALLDPLKVTLCMPGLTARGRLDAQGIPAAIVSRFLWERGLVVEKTGLYSMLVLFSLGITKGKWSTLLTELLEFKRCHDGNQPLSMAMPSLFAESPDQYRTLGLRDLCTQLHQHYRQTGMAQILRTLYADLPAPAVLPAEAYDRLVRGQVEAVPLEQLAGRIAAVMLVPYPPGIPLIMPGERFSRDNPVILDYLQSAVQLEEAFPGFAIEVHGLQRQSSTEGTGYTVDCLLESAPAAVPGAHS